MHSSPAQATLSSNFQITCSEIKMGCVLHETIYNSSHTASSSGTLLA
jgi:xanthine dehydrogenase molybdopterin-binding subunit B